MQSDFTKTMFGVFCLFFGCLSYSTNEAIVKLSNLTLSQLLFGRWTIQFSINILLWNIRKPDSVTNWYGDSPYIQHIWIRAICNSIGSTKCIVSQRI